MTQQSLVIIKPDGLIKSLTGNIISVLSETKLKIVAAKVLKVPRELAEEHYKHLEKEKGEKIFQNVIDYIMGKYHTDRVLALVYHGEDCIEKIRNIVGLTNPEDAHPVSIRGKYGRINSKTDVFENVIHASDSEQTAEKEIKLWFSPSELSEIIYPAKTKKQEQEKLVWK